MQSREGVLVPGGMRGAGAVGDLLGLAVSNWWARKLGRMAARWLAAAAAVLGQGGQQQGSTAAAAVVESQWPLQRYHRQAGILPALQAPGAGRAASRQLRIGSRLRYDLAAAG